MDTELVRQNLAELNECIHSDEQFAVVALGEALADLLCHYVDQMTGGQGLPGEWYMEMAERLRFWGRQFGDLSELIDAVELIDPAGCQSRAIKRRATKSPMIPVETEAARATDIGRIARHITIGDVLDQAKRNKFTPVSGDGLTLGEAERASLYA